MTARRPAAQRFILLEPLRTEHRAPRAGEESGLEEERHHFGLSDGSGVEALDCESLHPAPSHVLDERGERGPKPCLVRLAQRYERTSAPLDEQRRLAAEQDDVRACDARRPRAGTLRPRQGGTVGLGGIGRREDEGLRLLSFFLSQLAQALDRAG